MKYFALASLLFILICSGCKKNNPVNTSATTITFKKTFGGAGDDMGYSVQQTADGGYIIVGLSSPSWRGTSDKVYLIKTDGNGNTVWEKTLGSGMTNYGNVVQQTTDGGYIIAGYAVYHEYSSEDVLLIKTDNAGNVVWEKAFGGTSRDFGRSVQQTADGGYIVTGLTESFGPGSSNVYLVKVDGSGNKAWEKTFGGTSDDHDYGSFVQQTTDGGYIISGANWIYSAGVVNEYLIKTDGNGNKIWSKTLGNIEAGSEGQVRQTPDGGYIIVGITKVSVANFNDVLLVKTDSNGEKIWEKTFGGIGDDGGYSVQLTADGGFIIAGYNASGANNYDVYLVKTTENGNSMWDKIFGATGDGYGLSVQQTKDGGYIIAGKTSTIPAGISDVLLIKTDKNGNVNP